MVTPRIFIIIAQVRWGSKSVQNCGSTHCGTCFLLCFTFLVL